MRISQADINLYGQINGDDEKLHYVEEFSKKRGFRGCIAHGTLLINPLFDLLIKKYGSQFFSSGNFSVTWITPVCAGDEISPNISNEGQLHLFITNFPEPILAIKGESYVRTG